jgi:hypothetical protein
MFAGDRWLKKLRRCGGDFIIIMIIGGIMIGTMIMYMSSLRIAIMMMDIGMHLGGH